MPAHRTVTTLLASSLVILAGLAALTPAPAGAAVSWPTSNALLVGEVVTGGASASDEYVEITNASAVAADLAGHELVYVTASGATTTRKVVWSVPQPLLPGQHLLLANVSGTYAAIADATYSGGFAADGGSLVLRSTDGTVVDALGWGTAANGFVEGSAAPAPPARSSLERRPGGVAGNGADTNDNATDWFVQAEPQPQSLSAPPTPGGSPSPPPTASQSVAPSEPPSSSVEPTAVPTEPTPTESATPQPTVEPTASPTESPTVAPSEPATPSPTFSPTQSPPAPTDSPTPTPAPTPTPTTAPTPPPSATPTLEPSPSPSASASAPQEPMSIAEARQQADGAAVTVEGTLTVRLGVLEDGRAGFVQDDSAGIGLLLSAAPAAPVAAGSRVRLSGTVDDRYGERTIRVDDGGLVELGTADLPAALVVATGAASEALEGLRIETSGVLTATPDALADGTGLWIDDGSGPLRVVAGPGSLDGIGLERGALIHAVGPLGQRASGSAPGYRLLTTEPGSVTATLPEPSPSPSSSGTPQPTTSPTPGASTPGPTVSPGPSSSAGPTLPPGAPALRPIDQIRSMALGVAVRATGLVTAAQGQLGDARLIAIQDESAGIFVRLPGARPDLIAGRRIELIGSLAAPYGQLEIRDVAWLVAGPAEEPPEPVALAVADVGETVEGAVVSIEGTVGTVKAEKDGSLSFTVDDGSETIRAMAAPSARLTKSSVVRSQQVRLEGVVGQRATGKGKLDGYRLWLRSAADIEVLSTNGVGPATGTPKPSASPRQSQSAIPFGRLADALRTRSGTVDLEAVVTGPAGLFELGGPTVVVDDGTAALGVLLPKASSPPAVGQRLHLTGVVGTYRNAPRLVASSATVVGAGATPAPIAVQAALGAALEWRLVRASGRVSSVTRLGDRWRAELLVAGHSVTILVEPETRIPSGAAQKGQLAVVTGIVKRSASAADHFDILPRNIDDLRLGPELAASASGQAAAGRSTAPARLSGLRVDIADLASHMGATVVVSGLVADVDETGATLDDGTGRARIVLVEEAADRLGLLEPDDAIEVSGTVEAGPEGVHLRVVDAAAIVQLSSLNGPTDASPSPALLARSLASGDPGLAGATAPAPGGGGGLPLAWPAVGATLLAGLAALGLYWRLRGGHLPRRASIALAVGRSGAVFQRLRLGRGGSETDVEGLSEPRKAAID